MRSFTKKASAFGDDPLPGLRPGPSWGPQTPSLLLCPPNNPVRSTPLACAVQNLPGRFVAFGSLGKLVVDNQFSVGSQLICSISQPVICCSGGSSLALCIWSHSKAGDGWTWNRAVTGSLAVRPHATLAICVLSLALAYVAVLFGTPVTSPSKGAASCWGWMWNYIEKRPGLVQAVGSQYLEW